MPEIWFEIDERTGQLTAHIQGVKGPACEEVQRLIEQELGRATAEKRTPEYSQGVQTQPRIRPQGRP